MRVCLWLFSCCTLDFRLACPPHLAVFLISLRFLSATQPNVLTAEGATLSRLAVEAALRALRWFGLKLGLLWHRSFILVQPPQSHFYQILEGTKAFINVLTGSSLDSVVSLLQNVFVKFATRTDWRPFLCCGVLFWVPPQPTLISACWPLLSTLRVRSDLGAPQVVAARRASTAHISARKFQACTK